MDHCGSHASSREQWRDSRFYLCTTYDNNASVNCDVGCSSNRESGPMARQSPALTSPGLCPRLLVPGRSCCPLDSPGRNEIASQDIIDLRVEYCSPALLE
ncbi:hypothetical protein RRG08_014400 [Elysia crispata]|uniref:Uncharacterized protein n=1 Tax=Elysia crispata TaxID=231223 RepID=A0AAE1D591_9GAST|nr:hypothetical protein RRG08_014400 [Elysia crispata]